MNIRKNPVLLIFGYPLNFGGLVWIKRVSDYIEKNNLLSVRKVSSYFDPKKHAFQHIVHLRAVLQGCRTSPNIAILDTYGEATLLSLQKPVLMVDLINEVRMLTKTKSKQEA